MKPLRLLALSLALSLSAAAFSQQAQDVVYLKNGTIIHGSILEFQPGGNVKVKNNVGDIFVYPADQVEKMSKESASGDGIRYTSAAASYSNSSSSSSLIRGYRGFVDGGVYAGRVFDDGYVSTYTRIGFTTTHGFQFNPHIFFGGGLGWQIQAGDDLMRISMSSSLSTRHSAMTLSTARFLLSPRPVSAATRALRTTTTTRSRAAISMSTSAFESVA